MKVFDAPKDRYRWLPPALTVALIAALLTGHWLSYRAAGMSGVLQFGDIASILSALTLFVMMCWRVSARRGNEHLVWSLLSIGFGLWFVAEMVWGYYELALSIDTPYPSPADVIWVAGYVPLLVALILRYRAMQVRPPAQQLAAILAGFLPTLGMIFLFVVWPILVTPAGDRPLEKLFSLLYPSLDLAILFVTLLAALTLGGGRRATAWLLILIGLIVMSVIDLLFSYATWNGLYYAGGRLNLVTYLIDAPYPAFYLLIALGVFFECRLIREGPAIVRRIS